MQITNDLIEYLEKLARVRLESDEKEKVGQELQEVLGYIDTLNELDTEGVEPLSHAFPVTNVLRTDTVQKSRDREEILQNAPHQKDGCFKVPKTVE